MRCQSFTNGDLLGKWAIKFPGLWTGESYVEMIATEKEGDGLFKDF